MSPWCLSYNTSLKILLRKVHGAVEEFEGIAELVDKLEGTVIYTDLIIGMLKSEIYRGSEGVGWSRRADRSGEE